MIIIYVLLTGDDDEHNNVSGMMPIQGEEGGEQQSALADLIHRLVTEKFGELTNNFSDRTARRKVCPTII